MTREILTKHMGFNVDVENMILNIIMKYYMVHHLKYIYKSNYFPNKIY